MVGSSEKNRIWRSFNETKCLQQMEMPDLFHMCALCSELPSNTSTMGRVYDASAFLHVVLWSPIYVALFKCQKMEQCVFKIKNLLFSHFALAMFHLNSILASIFSDFHMTCEVNIIRHRALHLKFSHAIAQTFQISFDKNCINS